MTTKRRLLSNRQLDLLITLSDSRSMRQCGAAIGLSQSAVSRQIQEIEARLGTDVVKRNTNGLTLTDAGLRAVRFAKLSLDYESQMLFEVTGQHVGLRGSIHICSFSSVGRTIVVPAIASLLKAHAGLSAQLEVEELYLIGKRGALGEFDVFLTQVPVRLVGMASTIIGYEYNLLCESTSQCSAPETYIDHEPNDHFTEHYLDAAGIDPSGCMRRVFLDDIYGLIDGVALGVGRAVLPFHLIKGHPEIRPTPGTPVLRVPIVANYAAESLNLAKIRLVLDELRRVAERVLDASEVPSGHEMFEQPFAGSVTSLS